MRKKNNGYMNMRRCHFLVIVTVVAVMLIYKDTKMSRMFLKSGSHLPKKPCVICFVESPLKMMKNAFYFILKALFVP